MDTDAGDAAPSGTADAETQLNAIGRVSTALEGVGIDHWLFGGWGVDFWVGRPTRLHHDIDLAVWRRDDEAIHRALTGSGWRHTPFPDEVVGTRYVWHDALLELTFMVSGDAGQMVIPFVPGPRVWSVEPFGVNRRTLGGVTCRTLPLERLLADKERPRPDEEDAAKDVADHEALSRVLLDRSSAEPD